MATTKEQFWEILSTPTPTISICGDKMWKDKSNRFHRENGPAIEFANGTVSHYVDGKYLLESEWNAYRKNKAKRNA